MNSSTSSANAALPGNTLVVRCVVTCPMCGVEGVQYRLNPRMFWYEARDVDLKPCVLRTRRDMDGIHPPLYAIWHCPACRFTAEQAVYTAPLKGVLIRPETVAGHLSEARQDGSDFGAIVDVLSEGVELAKPDFFQTVKLHLLAVHVWDRIGSLVGRDYTAQARYCLLLAWLFRDAQLMDDAPARTSVRLQALFAFLRSVWPNAPLDEGAALERAVAYYEETLDAGSGLAKDPAAEADILQRIGRIRVKQGQADRARELLLRSIAGARAAAIEARRRLTAGKVADERERERLVDQERKLATAVAEGEKLVETLVEKALARQKQEAERILAGAGERPPEALRELLRRHNIDPRVIKSLLGGTPARRGLFASLRAW